MPRFVDRRAEIKTTAAVAAALSDLVENAIASLKVVDREDHMTLATLTQARRDIAAAKRNA